MKTKIILVEPKTSGNIGAIARLIKNFESDGMVLINPCELDDEAEKRAMHAMDVLESAEVENSFRDAVSDYDLVVGTSGISTDKDKRFIRKAESALDFSEDIKDYDGDVAVVFGREDQGLSNQELKYCDRLIRIPASDEYPVLNLSHAVGIVLYEIFKKRRGKGALDRDEELADESERERMIETFSDILDEINYPEHKKRKTLVMFRKILGRATTTRWEYHRLMGVLSQIMSTIDEDDR